MTHPRILGINAHQALQKADAAVKKNGRPERLARLREMDPAAASPRNPQYLATYQAELLGALAEIVADQGARISALETPRAAASADEVAAAAVDTGEETATPGDERPALSGELRELLANAGYADDQAVRKVSDEALLDVKGIGPAKLQEIREATAELPEAEPEEA